MTWVGAIMIGLLLLLGAGFSLVAALGVLRMPDLYTRMQAAAKTGTLGTVLMLAALAAYFGEPDVATRAAVVVIFLFLTAPVAAHIIARAGYLSGSLLWKGSVCDELKGKYDPHSHALAGANEAESKGAEIPGRPELPPPPPPPT